MPAWMHRGVGNSYATKEGLSRKELLSPFRSKTTAIQENQVLNLRMHSDRAGVKIQA